MQHNSLNSIHQPSPPFHCNLAHHFVKSLPIAAALVDRNYQYLIASQPWCQEFGLAETDLQGQSHLEHFPNLSDRLIQAYQQSLTDGCNRCLEEPSLQPNGKIGWQKWKIDPWIDEAGAVNGLMLMVEDISLKKHTEEALKISESRFRETARNLPGAIFQFTIRQGVWLVDYMSEGIWQLAGVTAEATIADLKTFITLIHPEDIADFQTSVEQVVATVQPWHYEGRLIKPTGEVRWWQGSSIPTRNTEGEIIFCGVLLDITDRKQAELAQLQATAELELRVAERTQELQTEIRERQQVQAELIRHKAQLDAFFSAANAGLVILDRQLRYLHINEALAATNGIPVQDHIGQTIRQVLPELADTLEPMLYKMIETGEAIYDYELVGSTPLEPGVIRHWLASYYPLIDEDGVIFGLGGVVIETTKQKRAEEELRRERDFNQKLIQTSPTFFTAIRPDGKVLMMNPAMLDRLGYTLEEVVGKDYISQFIPKPEQASLQQAFQQIITTNKIDLSENHVLSKSGQEFLVEWHSSVVTTDEGMLDYFFGVGIDVTERKQAEVALQEREAQLRQFVEYAPIAMVMVDCQMRYLVTSRQWLKEFNLTQDVIGRSHYEIFPEISDEWKDIHQKCLQGEIAQREEDPFPRADGSLQWIRWAIYPWYNACGEIGGIIMFSEDITQRQEAALGLKYSEERFRSLVTATSQIIWDTKADGEFTTEQPNWTAFTGQSFGELKGWGWINAIHPDDRPHTAEVWSAAVASRSLYQVEHRLRRLDGEYRHMSVRAVPLLEADGSVREWIGIHTDITDRKRAEEELRLSMQRFRFLADAMPQMVWTARPDGNVDYYNQRWYDYTGLTFEQTRDVGWLLVLHPDDLERSNHAWTQAYQTGGKYEVEYRIKRAADGVYRWHLGRAVPMRDEAGNIVQWVGTCTEIHDQKLTEATLQRSQAELRTKAEELEQTLRELQQTQAQLVQTEKMSSLGQLVAGVAHEINNPVNFIYGNLTHADEYMQDLLHLLELYQQHYPQPHREIQAEAEAIDLEFLVEDLPRLLTSMKVGADRIQKIVLALRNFSRMDEADVKEVNIHEGIDSTLMILQNRIKDKPERRGIEIIKQYGELPLVECYAGQLNQVFMNILSNAIDALDERDNLRSSQEMKQNPSCITISTHRLDQNRIQIRIADNGKGMEETTRKRLFEPFFTTKPIGKGTGLGLSISYQVVVDKHRGELSCHSSPGNGAEFVITLPCSPFQRIS